MAWNEARRKDGLGMRLEGWPRNVTRWKNFVRSGNETRRMA